jgi:DNA ligase-1
MTAFRPMLAATLDSDSIANLHYPLIATPKIDGVRTVILEGEAFSRALKPVPNRQLRHWLESCFGRFAATLDGEFILPGKPFEVTSGAWRNADAGLPADWQYLIFDAPGPGRYTQRLDRLAQMPLTHWASILPATTVRDDDALLAYEAACLAGGYEGVMLRDPDGLYKHGRSTLREQGLMKLKRFRDSEAAVVSTKELLHNNNTQQVDAFGLAKRSHHRANLVPCGTLGALVVRGTGVFEGITFDVGTGFTAAQRQDLWVVRKQLIGMTVNFTYQETGVKNKPRFPSFKGFRGDLT